MNLYDLFLKVLNADYTQIKENAASYCVEKRGTTLYLFFEKSNGAQDWKNNLDFPAAYRGKGSAIRFAHRGFLRVWNTIQPLIKNEVENKRVERILIAGYSHGAALALLCYDYCLSMRPELSQYIEGFGFGCPRVVWGALSKKTKARFRRFTVIRNGSDLVTHLPPRLFGFRHVGNFAHVGRGMRYGLVGAHKPENYSAELKGYARGERQ